MSPRRASRVAVVGEVVADLVEQPDGAFVAHPGGSPANVALALARLGDVATLLARLSDDVFGRRARAHLAAAGVDLSASVAATEPSTLAVASMDAAGRASYDFWTEGTADWQWTDAELAPAPGPGVQALHTGSLASWTAPGDQALLRLLERARADRQVTVCYDPNVRPSLLGTPDAARDRIERAASLAHVVKASDEDLAWLYPRTGAEEVARHLLGLGPTLVVVTAGPDGATALRSGSGPGPGPGPVSVSAPAVTVVDTVGAGDTFTAGLLHGLAAADLLGSEPADRLSGTTDEVLRQVLTTATGAAALTCTRAGCDPPSAAELGALLSG